MGCNTLWSDRHVPCFQDTSKVIDSAVKISNLTRTGWLTIIKFFLYFVNLSGTEIFSIRFKTQKHNVLKAAERSE